MNEYLTKLFAWDMDILTKFAYWFRMDCDYIRQNRGNLVTQSYRACKMVASCNNDCGTG